MIYKKSMLVYALVNIQDRIYVGMTQNLQKRLADHNYARVFSTKGFRPWKVLYCEKCSDRKSARTREKYFKSGIGKEFLKSLLPL
ncbi:MAG: GIY-YIG nuclease family protein [bacterium]|nr:GIY-YIG nuclease family protein [bacterium]